MGDLITPTMKRHEELKIVVKNLVFHGKKVGEISDKTANSYIQLLVEIFEDYG